MNLDIIGMQISGARSSIHEQAHSVICLLTTLVEFFCSLSQIISHFPHTFFKLLKVWFLKKNLYESCFKKIILIYFFKKAKT